MHLFRLATQLLEIHASYITGGFLLFWCVCVCVCGWVGGWKGGYQIAVSSVFTIYVIVFSVAGVRGT